jgi:hypothetical protein
VTALRKKEVPKHRRVVTVRTDTGSWTHNLTVIDRDYTGTHVIDFLVERTSQASVQSLIFPIKDTETLDELIEALMELRETYQ